MQALRTAVVVAAAAPVPMALPAAPAAATTRAALARWQCSRYSCQAHASELCSHMDSICRLYAEACNMTISPFMSLELDSAPICLELLTPSEAGVQHVTLTEAVAAAASAAGSIGQQQPQQQLWSLLGGLIKRCLCHASSQQLAQGFPAACRHTVAYATRLLVLQPMQRSQPGEGPAATISGSAGGSGSCGGTAAQAPGISTAAVLSVQDMAPWLVLCGRCLLSWAAELITALDLNFALLAEVGALPISKQQETVSIWKSASLDITAQEGDCENPYEDGFQLQDVGLDFDKGSDAAADLQLLCTAAVVLQAARDAGQLTTAGYDMTKALTALQTAAVLAKQAMLLVKRTKSSDGSGTDSSDDDSSSDDDGLGYTVTRYGQGLLVLKLQQAGLLLAALPFGWGCNNLACSNFSKSSELQIVKGKARTCSGCGTARYCKQCQTAHWKQHKGPCRAIAATAAAGTAGAVKH